MTSEQQEAVKRYKTKPYTANDIAKRLGVTAQEVKDYLKSIRARTDNAPGDPTPEEIAQRKLAIRLAKPEYYVVVPKEF